MPGLVPGIHVFTVAAPKQDVGGRDEPGHDKLDISNFQNFHLTLTPNQSKITAILSR